MSVQAGVCVCVLGVSHFIYLSCDSIHSTITVSVSTELSLNMTK